MIDAIPCGASSWATGCQLSGTPRGLDTRAMRSSIYFTSGGSGRLRRAGKDAELLHLGKAVGHAPVLNDLAITKAARVYHRDLECPPRRTAQDFSAVGALTPEPRPDLVPTKSEVPSLLHPPDCRAVAAGLARSR